MNRRAILSISLVSLAGCTVNLGDSSDDSDGDDDSTPLGTDDSVRATIYYNAQDVGLAYAYLKDNAESEANTPTNVVLHTGENPEDGEVVYEVDDPQSSEDTKLEFSDFGVEERENLPNTSVTVTYEDGSTEVISDQSVEGNSIPIREEIIVDQDLQTGETVITAHQFDAEYITVESDEEIGRIEEPGGSVTIPIEEVYTIQEGDRLSGSIMFRVVAHVGGEEKMLDLVDAGFPEPEFESTRSYNDRHITEFKMSHYDEIQVSSNNIAVGTDNPDADLSEQIDVPITEPTTTVSEIQVIVEVKTENGYLVTFFTSIDE
ncbi:hypothetical protein [Halorubrum lipolyticum]|uniref:hypothetical protein n=1 Tax=Halorubrum lipolyticum TaxID=368624 RepID=UPI0011C80750|nr:hypothetical protein [Halorubrum lipolyticum]